MKIQLQRTSNKDNYNKKYCYIDLLIDMNWLVYEFLLNLTYYGLIEGKGMVLLKKISEAVISTASFVYSGFCISKILIDFWLFRDCRIYKRPYPAFAFLYAFDLVRNSKLLYDPLESLKSPSRLGNLKDT